MTDLSLEAIRNCFEGVVPAMLATCDAEGVPNVSLVSQVHFVDCEHVALSYQFFNKTRRNLLDTGMASVVVSEPETVTDYRLDLVHEETQDSGPLFETMKAKLAGIASHSGMEGVFRLLGADIFRVLSVTVTSGPCAVRSGAPRNLLSAVRRSWAELGEAHELGALFDCALDCLRRHFSIEHAIILMRDTTTDRLYTVASTGYPRSGIGSEIALGHGVIGDPHRSHDLGLQLRRGVARSGARPWARGRGPDRNSLSRPTRARKPDRPSDHRRRPYGGRPVRRKPRADALSIRRRGRTSPRRGAARRKDGCRA
jgi:hypothetical protein